MSIATIVTVALSFGILGGFVFFALGLNDVAHNMLNEFEIGVFLKNNVSETDRATLSNQVSALPHVASVTLVTKEAAWAKMKADQGRKIDLEGVEVNPLPDKFRVKLDDPAYLGDISDGIGKLANVDEVVGPQEIVKHVVAFAGLVKWIGLVSAVGLFLIAAFIINNTIRLTIYARRREIRIMQLVGASNWFIRLPLVLEGMFLGAIGGGIAYLMVTGASRYVVQLLQQKLPLLSQFSTHVDPMQFVIGMVALGCIVGAIGSMMSIRKFLKV